MYLRYVHSFRAVSIVIIVAGHALFSLAWSADSVMHDLLLDLLDGGTVLFVFVAGFLFHHLAGRYRYRDYLTKKVTNVLLPYLVVSIPAVIYTVYFTDLTDDRPQLADTSEAYQGFWLLLKGGATFNYPLWFVPMITVFYLAAPLLIQFVRHPRLYLMLVPLIPLSMLAHRTDELDTLTIALYFLPAYLAGMCASQHRAQLETFLDRRGPLLCVAWLAMALTMFALLDHHGNYYGLAPFSQEHGPVDWMFAQKLLMCFALLALLRRFDERGKDRLRFLGDISFTIFFVHGYVLFAVLVASNRLIGGPPPGNLFTTLLLTVTALGVAAAGTILIRRWFGSRSRHLIGS